MVLQMIIGEDCILVIVTMVVCVFGGRGGGLFPFSMSHFLSFL
jgi:hypothetical protein